MTRKLRPCGTKAAYERHRRNNETPCDLCKAANTAKHYPGMNVDQVDMTEALEKDPPVIQWVLDKQRRVMVAAAIYDPHAETGGRNRSKAECKYGHPFDEVNTYIKSNGYRECRTCKKRHNDSRGLRPIDIEYLGEVS